MRIGKTGKEQTKFEILESYKYYKLDLEASESMVERWSTKLEDMAGSPSANEMFSGGFLPTDRVGEYVELWQGIVDRLIERMKVLKQELELCEQICDEMPEKYGTIMRMRYIHQMSLREVAEKMHYSEDRVRHLALEAKEILNIAQNSTSK